MISRRRLDALLNRSVPLAAREFREAFRRMSLGMDTEAVEAAVRQFDIPRIMAGINFDNIATRAALRRVEGFYREIGELTSKNQNITRQRPVFDAYDPRAVEFVRRNERDIMGLLRSEQANSLNRILGEGYLKGKSAETIALDLVGREDANKVRQGGVIGLTTREGIYVDNVTDRLLGQGDALLEVNSSTLFTDAEKARIAEVAATGGVLAQSERDRYRAIYVSRLLRSRGRRIARTELGRARDAGQEESVEQLIDAGYVGRDEIVKTWNTMRDPVVREDHAYMEGDTVAMGANFNVAGHMAPYPHHPSLPGSLRINCRCSVSYSRRSPGDV